MSKKTFTPLENLNYKPIKVRNHKFLTGFIFSIIFLIVFGFLIFGKLKKLKPLPGLKMFMVGLGQKILAGLVLIAKIVIRTVMAQWKLVREPLAVLR